MSNKAPNRSVLMLALSVLGFILLLLPFQQLVAQTTGTTKVVVRISGLRNAKGMVVVRLWNSKDGFPSSDDKAFRKTTVAIANGEAVAIFSNVPQGTYAVSSFHDENGNGKFDTRFPRIPTEGYAISNDVRGKLGPPPYEPARTQVGGAETKVFLSMHY